MVNFKRFRRKNKGASVLVIKTKETVTPLKSGFGENEILLNFPTFAEVLNFQKIPPPSQKISFQKNIE